MKSIKRLVILLLITISHFSVAKGKPNIILIIADDTSPKEYGAYGGNYSKTPNIDSLAANGVKFQTAWGASVCYPSRVMLMTGKYPTKTQWWTNEMRPNKNEAGGTPGLVHPFIGEYMRQAGYATVGSGKWHLGGKSSGYERKKASDPDFGFDQLKFWPGNPYTTEPSDFINTFINEHSAKKRAKKTEKPFFAYLAFHFAHKKWPAIDAPDGSGQKWPAGIKTQVEYLDWMVGSVINTLKTTGEYDNTIVMFTADNGTQFYGKHQIDERGVRLPFIVSGPEEFIKVKGTTKAIIDFTDVLPTLVELGGGICLNQPILMALVSRQY